MNLFRPILGLGFLAGAAYAAVKLVELFDKENDIEWTAVMGEMPEEEYTVPAPKMDAESAPEAAQQPAEEPAAPAPEAVQQPAGEPAETPAEAPAEAVSGPVCEAPEAPAAPEEAETKEPERVTVHPRRARIDPTTIACAEDFQDWDQFGCRS